VDLGKKGAVMKRLFENSLSLRQLGALEYRKPTIVILVATLVAVTFKYYGSKAFYLENLSVAFVVFENVEATSALYVFASSFVLLGLVPLVVVKFVFRQSLADYGVQMGDTRFGWKAVALISPVMILSAYPSASMPEFITEYPLNPLAGASAGQFVQHAFFYLFFYLGWEFCFRGFVQFGLRDSIGDWNAILVQTALSCIVHIGKPSGEIYSSIIGALVWGVVVFRSRSLVYAILTHWLLGISLDLFIVIS
jgi:membrane protease YdiL (CAAX protease family)